MYESLNEIIKSANSANEITQAIKAGAAPDQKTLNILIKKLSEMKNPMTENSLLNCLECLKEKVKANNSSINNHENHSLYLAFKKDFPLAFIAVLIKDFNATLDKSIIYEILESDRADKKELIQFIIKEKSGLIEDIMINAINLVDESIVISLKECDVPWPQNAFELAIASTHYNAQGMINLLFKLEAPVPKDLNLINLVFEKANTLSFDELWKRVKLLRAKGVPFASDMIDRAFALRDYCALNVKRLCELGAPFTKDSLNLAIMSKSEELIQLCMKYKAPPSANTLQIAEQHLGSSNVFKSLINEIKAYCDEYTRELKQIRETAKTVADMIYNRNYNHTLFKKAVEAQALSPTKETSLLKWQLNISQIMFSVPIDMWRKIFNEVPYLLISKPKVTSIVNETFKEVKENAERQNQTLLSNHEEIQSGELSINMGSSPAPKS